MITLHCPYCGPRSHDEFRYVGDATKIVPPLDAGVEAHFDYVYLRDNPRGQHVEYWQHIHGCRAFVKVLRDTVSHAVLATGLPADTLSAAEEGR